MRVHRGKAVLVGATALAIAITGCSSSKTSTTSNGNSSGKGTLIYGESTDFPENLNPLISAGNSTATANLEVRLFNGPFRITPAIAYEADPDQVVGQPTSALAGGQQVVTYKINPKAVWDDGVKITEKDYAYTWQAQKSADPKTGCPALLGTTGYDQIASVTAGADDHTVVVKYQKGNPFPDWQSLFSPLLSAHVMDKGSNAADCAYITKGWATASGFPAGVTNGPWQLAKSDINVPSKTFTLTHNPKYWGASPKLAKLVDAYIGSDPNTNVTVLQNQEAAMIYPQPQLDLVKNLKGLSSVTTEINFGVAFEHLDFNIATPGLSDVRVRQAIALAIDRKALVQATVGQFSDKATVLGNRLLMTNQGGYVNNGTAYDAQNIAKAKQLIQAAGGVMGQGGIYSIKGKPLSFAVETTQNNPLRDQTIATIANQVKAAGIKLTEKPDPNIFGDTTQPTSLAAHGYQLALFAWVGGPSLSSNASIYQTGGGQNYTGGGDKTADGFLKQMTSATTTDAEKAAANAADKQLWTDMFTLPLYQKPTLLAFDNTYTGIADNATQAGPLWNSEGFAVKS
ncbi:MAG: ABC transporter family substrate-binding protein [Jatrophihabitantaceae bacterium]